MMTLEEIGQHAQQRLGGGRFHLYMYTDQDVSPRQSDRLVISYEFAHFKLKSFAG